MSAETLKDKTAAERKQLPLVTGVLDYFPDALLAVAEVSRIGNDQHNPGQPLHWDKSKSTDHADAAGRHLLERGKRDSDGARHSAKAAWRTLALLQQEIEAERLAEAQSTIKTYYQSSDPPLQIPGDPPTRDGQVCTLCGETKKCPNYVPSVSRG